MAVNLTDLDYERLCLACTPERNSDPRQLNMSNRSISILNILPTGGRCISHSERADPSCSVIKSRGAFYKEGRREIANLDRK
jgi:hypothetical protein